MVYVNVGMQYSMYLLRLPVVMLLFLTADSKVVIALTLISYVEFECNSD